MRYIVLILTGCIIFLSCDKGGQSRFNNASQTRLYKNDKGLYRFLTELNITTNDTTILVVANNKSCNCGGAHITEVDSMMSAYRSYPIIWVLQDRDTLFEANISSNHRLLYANDYDMKEFGFPGIYPQMFILCHNKLIAYKALQYKK